MFTNHRVDKQTLSKCRNIRSTYAVRIAAIPLTLTSLALAGCGSHSLFSAADTPGPSLSGFVSGGGQALGGAAIQLYAAADANGSASTPLLAEPVYSNAQGGFTIAGQYSCPSASAQVYLAAAVKGTGVTLMSALGQCSAPGRSSTPSPIKIDELTTVASVSVLAPYMQSVSSIAPNVSGTQNLQNAFTTAGALTSILQTAATNPGAAQSRAPMVAKLVTLADVLAGCSETAAAAGSAASCAPLFSYAASDQGEAPQDTVAATLSIVNHPTRNVGSIYALRPALAPFQPGLASAPVDWSISAASTAPAPSFSLAPGNYNGAQSIALTDVPGAYIFYNTGAGWAYYSGAFTLSSSATVQAIAYTTTLSALVTATYNISFPTLSIAAGGSVGVAQSATGTVTLSAPSPQGGATINLASSAPSIVQLSSSSIYVPQGQSSAAFTYKGLASGSATLTASGSGFAAASTQVAVNAPVSITVAPGSVTLAAAQTQQFTAAVANSSNTAVSWTMSPNVGSLSSSGLYTAPASVSAAQTITVTATSAADSTKKASASVALAAPAVTGGSNAVQVYPGNNVAAIVAAAPTGTTFHLNGGVYRLQQIVPRSGDTFIGDSNTDLTGALVLTNFSNAGGLYVSSYTAAPGQSGGSCASATPACIYPEDLFIDNKPLQRVTSQGAVAPGSWFLNYGTGQIFMADSPAGHTVEVSSARSAFSGSAANVTIQNVTVEKYAIPAQMGAIGDQYPGTGWQVLNATARLNHGAGISVASGSLVQGCNASSNGQEGIHALGNNITIASNTISNNNYAGFDSGWEAGGLKSSATNLMVKLNTVASNIGPGLWTDINSSNVTYDSNTVTNNANEGIKHEISYAATISNNTVANNGSAFSPWLWGSQILVQNSQNVNVFGNIVTVNANYGNGISLIYQYRGTGTQGPWITTNNNVHDNTVYYSGQSGQSGMVSDSDQSTAMAWPNTFNNNTYYVPSTTYSYWNWNNAYLWPQFQAAGFERQGTVHYQ